MTGNQTNEEKCKELLNLAENARVDWQTKHAASCNVEGQHSQPCQDAYKDYQTKLSQWTAQCSKP